MNCKKVYTYICEHLDENMNSPRCRAIKRHLDGCPDCQAYLDSVKKVVSLYRMVPTPEVPSAVHKKLIKTINVTWKDIPVRHR